MKRHLAAAVCAALLLCGCSDGDDATPDTNPGAGGGVGNSPPPPVDNPPSNDPGEKPDDKPAGPVTQPTDVGAPLSAPVSAVIGAQGGQLISGDGKVRVEIPAGAFATDQTVSIQEITNLAHGAKGAAYRITPEGLNTPVPMTLHFTYTDDNLAGTALQLLSIAYQDAARLWHVYEAPVVDTSNHTLSVKTRHFSDWSFVSGAQLRPNSATVLTGDSLELRIEQCDKAEFEDEDEESEELIAPTVGYVCAAGPLTALAANHWSVNGVEGGSAASGIIVADADRTAGKATYTAPATPPEGGAVSVSVQYSTVLNEETAINLLVSTLTIREEAAGCETLRTRQTVEADLSFQAFAIGGTAEYRTSTGNHEGSMTAVLRKIETGPTFGFWTSYPNAMSEGYISVNDSFSYSPPSGHGAYSGTLVGSGAPHVSTSFPSLITLRVDYATCTFDLFGSFVVDARLTRDGSGIDSPTGIGAVYLYGQTVPLHQQATGTFIGELGITPSTDIDRTGYVPFQETSASWTFTGNTIARWTIDTRE